MSRIEAIREDQPVGDSPLPSNDNNPVVFDLEEMGRTTATATNTTTTRGRRGAARHTDDDVSVALTDLASSVGSVVLGEREAFMKSFTFWNKEKKTQKGTQEQQSVASSSSSSQSSTWGIEFAAPVRRSTAGSVSSRSSSAANKLASMAMARSKLYLPIESVSGALALSRIREGDYLKSINGRTVGASMTGARALDRMKHCFDEDGYLHIITKNREEGVDDILLHVTVIKPKANMSCQDMGLTVWVWGYLCIKAIKKDSMFKQTALKENDHIVSINEISCENLTPEQFHAVFQDLPREVTITVLRRKQRVTGQFG